MLRLAGACLICLATFAACAQSNSKYQVGTITEVKHHDAGSETNPDVATYDVSIRVADTVYVVLYTPPLGQATVKYAAGREMLVLVGKNTITYNDIMGKSSEVPIESQKPVVSSKRPQ